MGDNVTMTETPDYQSLIDSETWAFIERTAQFYPADAVERSIEAQREVYDTMCREFFHGYPQGVSAQDIDVPGAPFDVQCRHYRWLTPDTEAVVVYFHGGGFVVGGLDSHDDVCAELCGRTGFQVIAADYRMSPEYDHPAAFDDAWSVYQWAREEFSRPVVLCGDSAGGNLAAAVAHEARNRKLPAHGQVLIYPGLGGDINAGSYLRHAHAPMLTRAEIEFYADIRTRDKAARMRPDYAPLLDLSFASLPPTIVFSAECDPLCDDGRDYCEAIQSAGGRAHWYREAGMVHGYLRARHSVTRANDSFSRIVASVAALGKNDWPLPG